MNPKEIPTWSLICSHLKLLLAGALQGKPTGYIFLKKKRYLTWINTKRIPKRKPGCPPQASLRPCAKKRHAAKFVAVEQPALWPCQTPAKGAVFRLGAFF